MKLPYVQCQVIIFPCMGSTALHTDICMFNADVIHTVILYANFLHTVATCIGTN